MKKILIAFVLGLLAATGVGYAITVNTAAAVLGDSENTRLTVPYRDASAEMEGAKFSTAFLPLVRTAAQLDVLVPVYGAGSVVVCSDCTVDYSLCTATGTLAAQWARAGSATVGCGSGN